MTDNDMKHKYPDVANDYYKKAPAILYEVCKKCGKIKADGTCDSDYCPIEEAL